MPLAATGVELSVVVPLPSWPWPLDPQQLTEPSARRAQVWPEPAEIAVAAAFASAGLALAAGVTTAGATAVAPLAITLPGKAPASRMAKNRPIHRTRRIATVRAPLGSAVTSLSHRIATSDRSAWSAPSAPSFQW